MIDYTIEQVDADEWEYDLLILQTRIFPDDSVVQPEDGVWWLLFYGPENPVGFASVRPSIIDPEAWFLSRCGILPEHTGHGLQRSLINHRLSYLRAIGVKTATTYTVPDNPASSNNLIKCGFKLYRPEPLFANEDTLYWKRPV